MTKPVDKEDKKKKPEKEPGDKLHRADETLGEPPGGGPNATERSRLED